MQDFIVFINPPYERIAKGHDFTWHITDRSPSLGLLHLAAQARQDGYSPVIIESDIHRLDIQQTIDAVMAVRPVFVGITLFTIGVWNAAEIARNLKQLLPDVKILVGGPHISSMGMETMSRFPEFDLAVVGEGEGPLSMILNCYRSGGDVSNVHGVIYRDADGQPVRTTAPPIEKNLDRLPFPAWDLLPGFPHVYSPGAYDFPLGPTATIAASRGCPFKCRFCDTSTFGARLRTYSPTKVFEMMLYLKEKYAVRHILFVDDLFLASSKRATEICNLMIENQLGLTWSCLARVDSVRPELLKLMKQAGCWEIAFGIESGSNEMLEKMHKSAEVEKARQAIHWTSEAGIRTKGLFILGYPGESEESIAQTEDFVYSVPLDVMFLTKFTPYPGSPIYVDLYGTLICDDHWEKMNGMNFVWEREDMNAETLDKHYRKILTRFYLRPAVFKHVFWMTLNNPNHLLRMMRFGLGFLFAKIQGKLGMLVN